MKRIFTLVLVSILFTGLTANAQWLISTSGATSDTVTFDASFTGVNEGVFAGAGIEAIPTVGQLNSNAWMFTGFSNGNTMFGGSYNSGDYAKGTSAGGEFSGGLYAFEVAAGDTAMGIQPTGSDFTPGDLDLKVVNTTGSSVDSVFISYELWVNNDADRANSFDLSYSINGGAYVPVSALNYTSTETSQGSVIWVMNSRSTGLNINLANNDTLLFRWSSADISGSGGRDEFALDDIHVTFTASAPVSSDTTKPEIVDAEFLSASSIVLAFSEPVTATSAQNVANYSFSPLSAVTNAVLNSTLDSVTLTLTPALVSGTLYTVNIMNIVDTSLNANMMDPVSGNFYFNSYTGTDLMITEIYHSQPSGGIQDIDYFELYNSSSSPISLAGMEITSGVEFSIDSNLIIPGNGYLVFVENIDSFNLAFPSVTNVIEYDFGSLSGGGETITLSNTLGDEVASVDYETSAPWPAYSNVEAIELCDLTTDYTDGMNWYVAGTVSSTVAETLYGTPGSANSCAAPPVIATYDIEVLRTVDMNGEPDSLDVYCAIEGIVHGKDMDGNAGYTFALIDDTRGITVHSFVDVDNYVVNEGDELRAVGSVKFYNGLTQFRVDSITVLSTGNCIDYPEVVFELNEETESEAIYIMQVKLEDPSAWPAPGSNANLNIITMDDDTLLMRIDKDTKIADTITSAPSGYFNVSGIGSQFTFSSPYDDGYQIMPQFVADIDTVPTDASGIFVNEAMVDNQTAIADPQGDYDSWIEIYNSTSNPFDLTGHFFGNDDTIYRFERCIPSVVVPANGYLLLWADDEMQDGPEHLPMMLNNTDYIGLVTKDAAIVDTLEWDSALADVSFGHDTDGSGTWVSFEESTPNATNSGGVILSVISVDPVNALSAYPNPVSNGNVNFNKVISFNMYSVTGQLMMQRKNVNQLNVSDLEKGIYIIETTDGEILKMIVK
ncbi:lamin tail domain-containing protein [bacterium SCSIO 12643]|nr:lamin tail domain-containing protein [bacterium SCSIO 12643]